MSLKKRQKAAHLKVKAETEEEGDHDDEESQEADGDEESEHAEGEESKDGNEEDEDEDEEEEDEEGEEEDGEEGGEVAEDDENGEITFDLESSDDEEERPTSRRKSDGKPGICFVCIISALWTSALCVMDRSVKHLGGQGLITGEKKHYFGTEAPNAHSQRTYRLFYRI